MAIGTPAVVGTGSSTAASHSTLTSSALTSSVAAGNYLLVLVAKDNPNTATGVSSDFGIPGISDTKGNTWKKIDEYQFSPGSVANDGSVIAVFLCETVTTALTTSDTITADFTGNPASASAMTVLSGTLAGGNKLVLNAAAVTHTTVSVKNPGSLAITASGASATRLYLRSVGDENSASPTNAQLTATAGFTKIAPTIANAGTAATSQEVYGEFILSATATQTSNPTNGGVNTDQVSSHACFEEVSIRPASIYGARQAVNRSNTY